MQYVLGAYSQIPASATAEQYINLLEKQLKPLLTYLYRNPEYRLLLWLDNHYFEWLEQNRPEIKLLISNLLGKGQLELLAGASNNTILSLIPVNERSQYIENSINYIKTRFGTKPNVFFCNYQIFNTTTIKAISISLLKNMIISPFNQLTGKVEIQKPFCMTEFNRYLYVFPTDDNISKAVFDFYKSETDTEIFLQGIEKHIEGMSNSFRTIMINLDQLVGKNDSVKLFPLLYEKIQGQSITPYMYSKEKGVKDIYYLPSSIYGRDFSIGGHSSVMSMIIRSPELYKNYLILNFLREVVHGIKKINPLRKQTDYYLEKADSGACYVDDDYRSMAVLTYSNKYLCKIEEALLNDDTFKMPVSANITHDLSKADIIYTKGGIAYIDKKGGTIQRLSYFEPYWDYAFCEGGLFADSVKTKLSDKAVLLSNREFSLEAISKNRTEAVYLLQKIDLNKVSLGVKKTYSLKEKSVVLETEIKNLKDSPIATLNYETKLNINLGKSLYPNELDALKKKETNDYVELEGLSDSVSYDLFDGECRLSVSSDKKFKAVIRELYDKRGRYKNHVISVCFPTSIKANGFEKFSLSITIDKNN